MLLGANRYWLPLKHHPLATQVVVIGAAEVDHAAWAQLDDTGGQGRYELTVVADEDQRARVVLQRQVQRFDGFHVQVVGRFVHDQHVGLLQDQLAEQHATLLTTGDDLDRLEDLIVGEQHAAQGAADHLFAQDHAHDFEDDVTLFDWMGQWAQGEQVIRGTLGRMLFSNDEILKSVKVISGGEQGRMLFGKLILQKPNVLVMDEPTNHLDMESIEALNLALENYPGTLIFVSHDREFVSSLATRIIELSENGVTDFSGSYDDYLRSQGVIV